MKHAAEQAKYTGYAIVTDGLWRKSISVIRALGKARYHICVIGDSYLTTGFWSRYTCKRFISTCASDDPDAFGRGLFTLLSSYGKIKPIIFPMEDASLIWCSAHRQELEKKAYILLPPEDSLTLAENKLNTLKFAIAQGFSCPATFFPESINEYHQVLTETVFDDVVLKPYTGSGSRGIVYLKKGECFDIEKYLERYKGAVIQERLDTSGDAFGVSVLMNSKSQPVAHFIHKRLEQFPNSGGPSTQRISIRDDALLQESVRLLKLLHWTGIAMVEWKMNIKTGTPVLMEINPRFWGSLELAVRSGVNFPVLYAKLAQGKQIREQTEYAYGIRCTWLLPGDILRYLTKKTREPLKSFLTSSIKTCEEWDWSDKRIFFASLLCQALLVLRPKYWKYLR